MQLQKVGKKSKIALIVIALVAAVLFADHFRRCSGIPLSREEALRRAIVRLQYLSRHFELGDPPPALVEEQYDSKQQTWIFSFRSNTCEVEVIADRCHGTDIGGLSEGCKQK
jgi:hypothetical protein